MSWHYTKNAVITGAGSGIGRALALELTGHGFKVGISDIDTEGAQQTLDMVQRAGGSGEIYRCDVRNPGNYQQMADHFFETWENVGLLVINAGIMAAGFIEEIPLEEWQKVVDTNLWGSVHGCRAFLPRMKLQKEGHILLTASMSGVTPPLEESPYNVSKAGVIALGESLKTELAPFNIGVTILNPMGVNTNVIKNSYCGGEVKELWDISFKHTKLTPADVARRAIRAVEKNKLYCFPHFHGKMFWYQKRFFPETFFSVMARLHRKGLAKPMLKKMARMGMM
jgi:hypothetical protein